MKPLVLGVIIFVIAFISHLALWRVRQPKNQTKTLSLIFVSIIVLSFIVIRLAVPLSFYGYLQLALFVIFVSLAYITTYPAIEVDSPTLLMVMDISKSGKTGLDEMKFLQDMDNSLLVVPRIKDLVDDKLIYLKDNKYMLTSRGRFFAALFIFYRRLLKSGKGG